MKMLVVEHTTVLNSTPEILLSVLLDHTNLDRFFDAKFKVISPANEGELSGGAGCIREVRTAGIRFQERICSASVEGIDYEIVGDFPLKNHHGKICFESENERTRITYQISCEPLWYTPNFLMKCILDTQILTAFKNLGKAF
jgi:hypothetical protein